MLKVAKFGGSSVAGAEQFQKVRHIVEADPARRIVVSSAAGKRFADDHKLTDLLYLCHAHLTYGVSCDDILAAIRSRFVGIRDALELRFDIEDAFDAYAARLSRDTSVDELVSRGEYFTSRLLAEYLGYRFVDAADCVFFGFDGQIDRAKTYEAIRAALGDSERIVIPGFYGRLPTGKIKVMTRGIVDNPAPIDKITYAELQELAFMGASVLHEDSISPVKEKGIALNIRNTNRPRDPGTMILGDVADERIEEDERFITGIAGRRNFTILTVKKRNMNTSASLRQSLEILDRYHAPVEHITLGLDSFALVSSTAALGDGVYDVIADIQKAVRPDDIQIQEGISLVATIGRKMIAQPGTSGRLFHALGKAGINIRTIAQGADELSIIVGVENKDFEAAIRVLYGRFAG